MIPPAHLARLDDDNYRGNQGSRRSSWRAGHEAVVRVDDVGLAEHLLSVPPSGARTPDLGARRLLPLRDERLVPLDPELGEPALRALLWAAILRAVERSCEGTSRIAVALGGIDSSAVLAAACEVRGASSVHAFSCDYDGGVDLPFAHALCAAYGVRLTEVRVADAVTSLRRALTMDGLPYWGFAGGVELHLLGTIRAHGHERVLTGVFGDDVLGGDATLFASALVRRPVAAAPALLRMQSPWPRPLPARLRETVVGPWLHALVPAPVQRRRVAAAVLARAPWLTPHARALASAGIDEQVRAYAPRRSARDLQRHRSRLLVRSFGARAQAVVESGVSRGDPLLEDGLNALCTAIPIERLYPRGRHRGLLRDALPSRVPASVRDRQSKAVLVDQMRELAAAGAGCFEHLRSVERLAAMGLVESARFQRGYAEHGPSAPTVWAALAAEAFLRAST